MRFWMKSLVAGAAGVVVTFLFWLLANPGVVGVVSSGQIMITLATVGSAGMLLGALHTIGEILEKR